MFLGYLWDQEGSPEEFLDKCSGIERDEFFKKFLYAMKKIVDTPGEMLKMSKIGVAFDNFGYFQKHGGKYYKCESCGYMPDKVPESVLDGCYECGGILLFSGDFE